LDEHAVFDLLAEFFARLVERAGIAGTDRLWPVDPRDAVVFLFERPKQGVLLDPRLGFTERFERRAVVLGRRLVEPLVGGSELVAFVLGDALVLDGVGIEIGDRFEIDRRSASRRRRGGQG